MSSFIPDSIFNHIIADSTTALSPERLKQTIAETLFYGKGKLPSTVTPQDLYQAVAYTVRQGLMGNWLKTNQLYQQNHIKTICYFSTEYLFGCQLATHLVNLNLGESIQTVIEAFGVNLADVINQEIEPSLGYSFLGQLPVHDLDALATLNVPAIGYGIRYEFGTFDQEIHHGWQVEVVDKWLRYGNPWEIVRPEASVEVKLGGHTEAYYDQNNRYRVRWIPSRTMKAVPYDIPISGYQSQTVNTLRLWKAEPTISYNSQDFNIGDYYGTVQNKPLAELITKVLYPTDEPTQGKHLRLEQQFFFVSASLQDMIRNHLLAGESLDIFHQRYTVQLHDSQPAIAIAELMRLFVDEQGMEWEQAWSITRQTFSYTNPTLSYDNLEKWGVGFLGSLLPRHLEIIYEINNRFLISIRSQYAGDFGKLARLSLIDEMGERFVRMSHLAVLGSYSVQGISLWQSQQLRESIFPDFYECCPEKFNLKTRGITPRRWLVAANPRLTQLIQQKLGDSWIKNLEELRGLEGEIDNFEFRIAWRQVKQENKRALAAYIEQYFNIKLNPDSLFEVQADRIHESKRQRLNILHLITRYNRLKKNPNLDEVPRTVILCGKAAPGSFMGKLMIKLIHSVAEVINQDQEIGDRLKVVFIPNLNITLKQRLYPVADLSEHLVMAGKEASAIEQLKLSLNGALTIGVREGAIAEIRTAVGAENCFGFGLTLSEVEQLKSKGYNPWSYYHSNEFLREIIDQMASGYFSKGDPNLFKALVDSLLYHDEYMVFADYQSYVDTQDQVSKTYRDWEKWTRMSILNVARLGGFSSDYHVEF